MQLFEEVVC